LEATIASPLGLLEELFGTDPWRLLLSTILLNRTRRIQVDVVMYHFLQRWSTPETVATIIDDATIQEMTRCIAPLGIKHRRAKGIVQFSQDYLRLIHRKEQQIEERYPSSNLPVEFQLTRRELLKLYHCGDYAADAYQIFIQRDWETIHPKDHALRAYVEWKRGEQSRVQESNHEP
jgi:endonuclease III